MSDIVGLGRRVSEINVSPQFTNYSKVIIHVSDETAYEVGNDTGRTLEITNPFGTQQMAENMLSALTGYQYQPYTADGALLDPAAEIGDAVNARGTYGGIYTRERTFGRLMKADVSAPQDEDINHEFQFVSKQEREFKRSIDGVKASLIIANDRIDATVAKTGGEQSSFGWSLQSDGHRWYANGNEVMAVTASGLKVTGEVQATTGKIGGFNITATSLWNNLSEFGGSQTTGVYIGTDGIQLGQNFKVDRWGDVTASNMTLTGTLMIGNDTITADKLRVGAQKSFDGYRDWNGTTSTVNSNGGTWTSGAGYGYDYHKATSSTSGTYPTYFRAGTIYASGILRASNFSYQSRTAIWRRKGAVGENDWVLYAPAT